MGVPLLGLPGTPLGLPGTPLTISSQKEKRFGFTVTTGFFCFTCKKGCCVYRDLHRNIDFVFDLLLSLILSLIFDLLYILHFWQISNISF